jgi:hypothetical protein
MTGSRSSRGKPWQQVLELKRQLMLRDPLGEELTDRLIEWWSTPIPDLTVERRISEIQRELVEKYDLEGLDLPQPVTLRTLVAGNLSRNDLAGVLWTPLGLGRPMSIDANWSWPGVVKIVRTERGTRWVFPSQRSRPPAGVPPTVILCLNLTKITYRDLARLTRDFKAAIRKGIRLWPADVPREPRRSRAVCKSRIRLSPQGMSLKILVDLTGVTVWQLSRLARVFTKVVRIALTALPPDLRKPSPSLAFLQTVSTKKFHSDLRRFDLHAQEGLDYRDIAWREQQERRGRHEQLRLPGPVPGEDSVEKSVRRIYYAIHRRSYRARRRRLDASGLRLAEYFCTEHGGSCPPECPRPQAWYRSLRKSLPSDRSGRGRERLPVDPL